MSIDTESIHIWLVGPDESGKRRWDFSARKNDELLPETGTGSTVDEGDVEGLICMLILALDEFRGRSTEYVP